MQYPSIFNDVLGPVMRGPSSSHCAAALRIGRICRDLVGGRFQDILIEFDPRGSLATTHRSQGSDMGLFGGFLGWEAHDERLPGYEAAIAQTGWNIHIAIRDIGAGHPNTYKMTFTHDGYVNTVTAISSGGGMIEIIEIDGAPVSIFGDYYETLIYLKNPDSLFERIKSEHNPDHVFLHKGDQPFIELKSGNPLDKLSIKKIKKLGQVQSVKTIDPVLPILSRQNPEVPFLTCEQMISWSEKHNIDQLWRLALRYESVRGGISEEEVYAKMYNLLQIMQNSVKEGLNGTNYDDRILGAQSLQFKSSWLDRKLLDAGILNEITLYVSALMEVKSAMGVIVAAPTAGACGALPGAILGTVTALDLGREEAVKALLSAGMIGIFIADQASFAAEVGGCQAECGSGSSMAAAALVTMNGGSLHQAVSAASLALQNSLGMICDPIANRVEAPCLGKNVMAASNALTCANMALSHYDALIPLDQVIQSMASVSKLMASELRCTAKGGLSITPASKALERKLMGDKYYDPEQLGEVSKQFKIC